MIFFLDFFCLKYICFWIFCWIFLFMIFIFYFISLKSFFEFVFFSFFGGWMCVTWKHHNRNWVPWTSICFAISLIEWEWCDEQWNILCKWSWVPLITCLMYLSRLWKTCLALKTNIINFNGMKMRCDWGRWPLRVAG